MLGRPLLLEGPQASAIGNFKKRLVDAGFIDMDNAPVSSESVSYLVLTMEDGTLHSLEWGLGEEPYPAKVHDVFDEVVEFGISALRSLIRK